ncbi:MAG: hypothetical protein HQ541_14865 [Mariniphaga sp.]|nr:hypothetical protein [Mariniphaga sp.]
MLTNTKNIKESIIKLSPENKTNNPDSVVTGNSINNFSADPDVTLINSIGSIEQNKNTHYYSYGNFNLARLLMHIIKQTGPVHAFMTSYSFSNKSINAIQNRLEDKQLLSFKVIIDNRVKSMSPKPFQLLSTMFNYRCTSIHAKIALLWNDNWKISIVTSQNATDNPKLERGIIYTDPTVFDFDHKILTNEFNNGTT